MRKTLLVILAVLVCCTFSTSCGKKYVHTDPAFSFKIPKKYEAEKLQGATEVARFANTAITARLPKLTASVSDRVQGVKLADIPAGVVENMKQTIPKTSRYKILEQKMQPLRKL